METVIYVDGASGSDQIGDGSVGKAYYSIQRALEDARVGDTPVRVQILQGTYPGFDLLHFGVPSPMDPRSGSNLTITGTEVAYTPAAGPSEGQISQADQHDTEASSITVVGAGWTPDELRGRFVKISLGAGASDTMIPISANTADTIEVTPGNFPGGLPGAGSKFRIMELGTIIDGELQGYPGISAIQPAHGNRSSAARIGNCPGPGNAIVVRALKFAPTMNLTGLDLDRSAVVVQNCIFRGNPAMDRANITVGSASRLNMRSCLIETSQGGAGIYMGGQSHVPAALYIYGSILRDGRLAIGNVNGSLEVTGTLIESVGETAVSAFGELSTSQIIMSVLDGCRVGFASKEDFSLGPSTFALGLNAVRISNCSTAIDLQGPLSGAYLKQVVGDGNSVGIRVSHGAFVGLTADVDLRGTTQLDIDGNTATLTGMRAASPRVIRDQAFGSMIYEIS